MPKLNEHLTGTQINKSTVNSDLVSFLQNVIESIGEIPKFDFSIDAPDEIVSNFFENYYIKIDENGSLSNFNIDITVKISTSEAEVIGYILNRSSHSRPLVVRGNEGVGKTTLLKYISSYLWFKCSSCKNLFIPIYVSLGSIESDYSSKQIFDFLDEQLYTKGFSLAYKYFLEEYKTILEWINIHSSFDFKGKFTKKKISEVEYLGSDEYFNSLDDISKKKLILDILEYHTTKIKPVVLFFDDVDRHNIDIHRITLSI